MMLDSREPTTGFVSSESGFQELLQHWGQARVDSPLHVIGRFDDAARQLIAVGAFIQAAFVAAFGFGNLKITLPNWAVFLLFLPLLAMIFCAAKVICIVPLQLEAFRTYQLFKGMRLGIAEHELDSTMDEWCKNVDTLARRKRRWLHGANWCFLIASAVTLFVVGYAAMRG